MQEIQSILIDELQKQYCLDNQILMMSYGYGLCVDVSYTSTFPENEITTKWVDEEGIFYDSPPYEEIIL